MDVFGWSPANEEDIVGLIFKKLINLIYGEDGELVMKSREIYKPSPLETKRVINTKMFSLNYYSFDNQKDNLSSVKNYEFFRDEEFLNLGNIAFKHSFMGYIDDAFEQMRYDSLSREGIENKEYEQKMMTEHSTIECLIKINNIPSYKFIKNIDGYDAVCLPVDSDKQMFNFYTKKDLENTRYSSWDDATKELAEKYLEKMNNN